MQYNYHRGPRGQFRNPYDHGIQKNCSDFLINGYNEDVEYVERQTVNLEEPRMIQMTQNLSIQNGAHHANGNGHVTTDVEAKTSLPCSFFSIQP